MHLVFKYTLTKRSKTRFVLPLLIAFVILPAYAAVAQIQDLAGWIGLETQKKMTKKIGVEIQGGIRTFENFSQLNSIFIQPGLDYELLKNFSLKPAVRVGVDQNKDLIPLPKNRLQVDFGYKLKCLKKMDVSGRIRYQKNLGNIYHENGMFTELPVLRERLQMNIDLPDGWEVSVGGELFGDVSYIGFVQSKFRVYSGVSYKIKKRRYLDVKYIYEKDGSRRIPAVNHIVSLSYSIELKKNKKKKDDQHDAG